MSPSTPKECLISTVHDLFSARNKLSAARDELRNRLDDSMTLNDNDFNIADHKYATILDLLSSVSYEVFDQKEYVFYGNNTHKEQDQFNQRRQVNDDNHYAATAESKLVAEINKLDDDTVIRILSNLNKKIDTILSAKSSHEISNDPRYSTPVEQKRALSTPTLNLWYFDFLAKLGQKIQIALGCKTQEEKLLNKFQSTAKDFMKNNRPEEKTELPPDSDVSESKNNL